MSTNISVKPAGLPTAVAYAPPGDNARPSTPTVLPTERTVTAPDPATRSRADRSVAPIQVTNKVTIDKDAAAIVFQTVDDRTSEVIGQYPAEGILRRRAYVRAMDLAKAETKAIPTDRKV